VKIRTALRLGRVAHLPTVTSNVLAAIALSGMSPSGSTIALVCFALSLMYVAGVFLNDAFDRDHDREHRPERPIPAGEVAAAVVFDTGFALLAGGIAVVTLGALAMGAGWKPVVSAVALGSLIVTYNASHKDNRFAPLLMTLCRLCVYMTAGLLVRGELCTDLVVGGGMLAAPFLLAPPGSPLVAFVALADAGACAFVGRSDLAVAAIGAFLATQGLRRVFPRD